MDFILAKFAKLNSAHHALMMEYAKLALRRINLLTPLTYVGSLVLRQTALYALLITFVLNVSLIILLSQKAIALNVQY